MKNAREDWMTEDALKQLFQEIGLASTKGENYTARLRKHQQVYNFILHLEKAINKLSTKRELLLVDCACGKSYLSFIANHYFTKVQNRNIKFCCIDYNSEVIESSRKAAKALQFHNMEFICNNIFDVKLNRKVDIIYSLHACDSATDMTIAKGILENANSILTVSCCQHTVRDAMKSHGLGAITRHGIYKERLSDMLADSMRALILEREGYKVSLFEYVPTRETPKNIMIRAQRIGHVSEVGQAKSIQAYESLKNVFHTTPKTDDLIRLNRK